MTTPTPPTASAEKAIREALDELMTPIGNLTDPHSRIVLSMDRQSAYRQAVNPNNLTALLSQLAELRAENDRLREDAARTERNCDMLKGQCERQAEKLTALHIAISDHNKDCARQCNQRKELGAAHCPMKGYDRDCGDCPRDGMLHLTQDGIPVEPWMEQEARYEGEMNAVAILAADGKEGAHG